MFETWKPVTKDGAPLPYEVSNRGRIRRVKGGPGARPGKILRPSAAGGYCRIILYDEGKKVPVYIHRLVLEAFVGPAPEGMEAHHKNGKPSDNRLKNLEWVTHHDNMLHVFSSPYHEFKATLGRIFAGLVVLGVAVLLKFLGLLPI